MAPAVQADLLLYPAGCNNLLQLLADRPVVEFAEYELVFLQGLVTLNDLQRYIHQFHLVGYVGLVAVRHNPLVTVDVHNIIGCQVLHVNESQSRSTDEHEDVTDKGQVGILKIMGHHLFQLFLRQELTFLAVRADVELCKRVLAGASVPRAERRGILPL